MSSNQIHATLPKCRHRGHFVTQDRCVCTSPRLVVPGGVLSTTFCVSECPYVDHAVDTENANQRPSANAPAPIDGGFTGGRAEPVDDVVAAPDSSVDEFIRAVALTSRNLPPGWQWWRVAQRAHRTMLERAIERAASSATDSQPEGHIQRGIVIAAGGPLYFACAFVCVWVLRRLGCTLPVEFWHLGRREIDDDRAAQVKALGVTCRDALEITPSPRRLTGWELKPFSVIHSRYDEVLFLDADNVPVTDPAYLFDEPEYRKRGAVFWPDPPPSFIPQLTWDVAGISDRGRMPFESGQFLIDKRRCRAELQVAMHLNEHSDFWYQYVYGDKDTFKLAWHKMNSCYAMPAKPALWLPPAIHQYDFAGRPLFTHVCRGKEKLIAGEPIRTLPQCDLATRAAAALGQLQAAPQHRLPT